MKKITLAYLAFAFLFPVRGFAVSGFVTPSALTITFNSVSLIDTNNNNQEVVSSPTTHTFNRTDSDLVASSLGSISVPRGRYNGVNVCYNTSRSVKLDGVKYYGNTAGGFTDNSSLLYSVLADSTAAHAISTSGTAVTSTGYVVGNGTQNCSGTTFATPICVAVAADQASVCQTGDQMIDPTVTSPDLQLILDMYHCVGIDATNNTFDSHVACYPYATLGKPGAAIHVAYANSQNYGDIALIFGNDKKLSYAAASSVGSITNFCGGVAAVTVTGAPSGVTANSYGPTWVMSFNSTSGKVQFATGNCGTSNTCTSNGMLTMDNVLQQVGSTVNVSCPADSAASPAYLGYTYTSGAGSGGGATTAFTVTRIVDPNNLFGTCDSSKAQYVSGSTPTGSTGGSCGSLP